MDGFFEFISLMFILVVLGLIVYLIYITYHHKRKRCIEFLMQNSSAIKTLNEINKEYNFYDVNGNKCLEHTYDNGFFFNEISCQDFLIYKLQFCKYEFEKEINLIHLNRKKYDSYCKKLASLIFGEYTSEIENINRDYLIKLEKRIVYSKQKKPILEFEIKVKINRSNLDGIIYDSKYDIFNSYEISTLISRMKNKNGNFYNDKEIWDSICRVERGKVSNRMRFAIYQRDGYRCVCCGRTQNETYLEIDHIKPISKGGKSTYDNLQTLCRRCNQYKGNTY